MRLTLLSAPLASLPSGSFCFRPSDCCPFHSRPHLARFRRERQDALDPGGVGLWLLAVRGLEVIGEESRHVEE